MFRPVVAIIRFLSFDSLKIILYNSHGGVFDEEISTSKPLLEHSTSILGVWVNHTPNKGFDVEISSSNTPPCELYRIIFSESNDKNLMMATTGRNM